MIVMMTHRWSEEEEEEPGGYWDLCQVAEDGGLRQPTKHDNERDNHSIFATSRFKISSKITCLTLNTFICERKIQIMLKKRTTFKKCANVGMGKCTKVGGKKQFS